MGDPIGGTRRSRPDTLEGHLADLTATLARRERKEEEKKEDGIAGPEFTTMDKQLVYLARGCN